MNDFGVVRIDGARRGLRFERVLGASPEEVWSALVEPERLARWLAPTTIDARLGGSVRVEFDADQVVTGARAGSSSSSSRCLTRTSSSSSLICVDSAGRGRRSTRATEGGTTLRRRPSRPATR